MPTLDWTLRHQIHVVDAREDAYLLANVVTGAWGRVNTLALHELQREWSSGSLAKAGQTTAKIRDVLLASRQVPEHENHDSSIFVIYKLTDECNYRCSYCYDRKVARRKDPARRDASIRQILDNALKSNGLRVNLLFHGGEPLAEFASIQSLVGDYREFLPSRLQLSIQTNLSYLDQYMLDFLLDHQVGMSVSVDGNTAVDNRLRMVGDRENPYELVARKIEELDGLEQDKIGLLLTIGEHNTRLLEILLGIQRDGYRSVSLSFMHEVHREARAPQSGALTEEIIRVLHAIARGAIQDLAVWTLIEWIRKIVYGTSEMVCLNSPCGAGREVITVLPSGEVGPCDSIFDPTYYSPDMATYQESLRNSSHMALLLNRNTHDAEPCSSCDVRAFCNGTCPGNAILEHGAADTVAAKECAFHYQLIRELMWFLSQAELASPLLSYCQHHVRLRAAKRTALLNV